MNFWKVHYRGNKEETIKTSTGGSYTVSASSCDEAQAEAAGMASLDGVTEIVIESCEPLDQVAARASNPYTSYTASVNTATPAISGAVFITGQGSIEDYLTGDGVYHAWTYTPPSYYTPYHSDQNQVESSSNDSDDTCDETTQTGYNSYTKFSENKNK